MKKYMFAVFVMALMLSVGLASAKTMIAGKVYNADFSETVAGADVMVSCTSTIATTVQNTTTEADGSYAVTFNEAGVGACNNGDDLTVYASHPSYGANSKTGTINDDVVMDWDLAIVNVPLVPEFGAIVGMITILGAVGVFFIVRRD